MMIDADEVVISDEAIEAALVRVESDQERIARVAAWEARAAKWPALGRVMADQRDKVQWAKVRAPRIGASDASSFAKIESWPLYLKAKLYNPFTGNGYTRHGNEREPHILSSFYLQQNTYMFAAAGNDRHVATPDAIKLGQPGEMFLAQAKTTVKPLDNIPPAYQRQMWWEMYVMDTDRTLFLWEPHDGDGHPTAPEPFSQWFYRDDTQISTLITIADLVLEGMDEAAQFQKELTR